MVRYNDYELIYLYQSENIEEVLEIMFKKYDLMIHKYLHLYQVNELDYDDFYQEAQILMYQTIVRFDERKGKTFTRFYELILKRRIYKLNQTRPKYQLTENVERYLQDNYQNELLDLTNLTNFEENVYQRYFVQNQKISFIAEKEAKSAKQIYNAIYRIKDKYRNNML